MTVRKTVKEDFAYIPACFGAIYILSFDEYKNIWKKKKNIQYGQENNILIYN